MWRRTKIAFWSVALVVAPIAFFYAYTRFLMEQANAGYWTWPLLALFAGPAIGFAIDFIDGRYSLFQKPPQPLRLHPNNWEDGLERPD